MIVYLPPLTGSKYCEVDCDDEAVTLVDKLSVLIIVLTARLDVQYTLLEEILLNPAPPLLIGVFNHVRTLDSP